MNIRAKNHQAHRTILGIGLVTLLTGIPIAQERILSKVPSGSAIPIQRLPLMSISFRVGRSLPTSTQIWESISHRSRSMIPIRAWVT